MAIHMLPKQNNACTQQYEINGCIKKLAADKQRIRFVYKLMEFWLLVYLPRLRTTDWREGLSYTCPAVIEINVLSMASLVRKLRPQMFVLTPAVFRKICPVSIGVGNDHSQYP